MQTPSKMPANRTPATSATGPRRPNNPPSQVLRPTSPESLQTLRPVPIKATPTPQMSKPKPPPSKTQASGNAITESRIQPLQGIAGSLSGMSVAPAGTQGLVPVLYTDPSTGIPTVIYVQPMSSSPVGQPVGLSVGKQSPQTGRSRPTVANMNPQTSPTPFIPGVANSNVQPTGVGKTSTSAIPPKVQPVHPAQGGAQQGPTKRPSNLGSGNINLVPIATNTSTQKPQLQINPNLNTGRPSISQNQSFGNPQQRPPMSTQPPPTQNPRIQNMSANQAAATMRPPRSLPNAQRTQMNRPGRLRARPPLQPQQQSRPQLDSLANKANNVKQLLFNQLTTNNSSSPSSSDEPGLVSKLGSKVGDLHLSGNNTNSGPGFTDIISGMFNQQSNTVDGGNQYGGDTTPTFNTSGQSDAGIQSAGKAVVNEPVESNSVNEEPGITNQPRFFVTNPDEVDADQTTEEPVFIQTEPTIDDTTINNDEFQNIDAMGQFEQTDVAGPSEDMLAQDQKQTETHATDASEVQTTHDVSTNETAQLVQENASMTNDTTVEIDEMQQSSTMDPSTYPELVDPPDVHEDTVEATYADQSEQDISDPAITPETVQPELGYTVEDPAVLSGDGLQELEVEYANATTEDAETYGSYTYNDTEEAIAVEDYSTGETILPQDGNIGGLSQNDGDDPNAGLEQYDADQPGLYNDGDGQEYGDETGYTQDEDVPMGSGEYGTADDCIFQDEYRVGTDEQYGYDETEEILEENEEYMEEADCEVEDDHAMAGTQYPVDYEGEGYSGMEDQSEWLDFETDIAG
jgi:hypothetical protein